MPTKFLVFSLFVFSTWYVSSQQLQGLLLENWVDGAWENRMEQLPFYSEDGRLLKSEIAHWNQQKQVWEKKTKTEFKRDENGNLVRKELSDWSEETESWIEAKRTNYTLNAFDKPITVFNEVRTEFGWENQSIEESIYDENGKLIEKIIQRWHNDQVAWIYDRKFIYEFNVMQVQGYSIFTWDKLNSRWQPYSKATYLYGEDNSLQSINYQMWQAENWMDHSVRRNKKFDEGFLQLMEVEQFDPKSESWKNASRVEYSMTDFEKRDQAISKRWNEAEGTWVNLQRSTYTYSKDGQMMEDWLEENVTVTLFPNPTTDKIVLQSLPTGTITILDAQGKIIQTITNNQLASCELDVSKWENGFYSVRVKDREVKQFVKQ